MIDCFSQLLDWQARVLDAEGPYPCPTDVRYPEWMPERTIASDGELQDGHPNELGHLNPSMAEMRTPPVTDGGKAYHESLARLARGEDETDDVDSQLDGIVSAEDDPAPSIVSFSVTAFSALPA